MGPAGRPTGLPMRRERLIAVAPRTAVTGDLPTDRRGMPAQLAANLGRRPAGIQATADLDAILQRQPARHLPSLDPATTPLPAQHRRHRPRRHTDLSLDLRITPAGNPQPDNP